MFKLKDFKFDSFSSQNVFISINNMEGVSRHWTMEDGYDSIADSTSDIYPYRVFTYVEIFSMVTNFESISVIML